MIKFVDLQEQQSLIKSKIVKRINNVLDHGQYIMGPEISELQKKLAIFSKSKSFSVVQVELMLFF